MVADRRRVAGLVLCCALLAGCGDDDNGSAPAETPALLVERAHDAERTNDFLRIAFLPASVEPTTLGAPGAVRVFVAASPYFIPALALAEVAAFLGTPEVADLDFVGMRCQPAEPAALAARLATWPQVFDIIRADLGGQYSCPPPAAAPPENAVYCIAAAYVDQPDAVVARPLAAALEFGAGLLEDGATADIVRRRYGIHPAFSGLGLSVLGSADGHPLSAAESLQRAVSPEYLVRNATLGAGGCRCIRVAPYPARGMDPLDPQFISQQGDLGRCRAVPKLRFGS
jgi:hypothetical protein